MAWLPQINHTGFQALRANFRRYRSWAVVGLGGTGLLLYYSGVLQPTPPPPVSEVKPALSRLSQFAAQKADEDQLSLERQHKTAKQLETVGALEKQVQSLANIVERSVQERKMTTEDWEKRMAAQEKATNDRVEAQIKRLDEKQKAQKPAPPAPTPKVRATPAATTPPTTPSTSSGKRLVMLKSDGQDTVGAAPRADHRDVPYLQYGSLARGRVITGAMASSQAYGGRASSGAQNKSGLPILFEVLTPFTPPHELQGPGRNSTGTEVPLQGCRWGGRIIADLASSRGWIELDMLSCVMPSGEAYVQPLKGYVTDRDGTYGMVGKVTHHESAAEAKLFLTSLLQEFSAAFGYARAKVLVTGTGYGYGGGPQPGQGFQTGLQKMADLYLRQMELLMPTLWIPSGDEGWLIVEDNVHLDGMPTEIVMQQQFFTRVAAVR